MEATTNKKYFKELLKTPLFFMEKKHEVITKQNHNSTEIEDYFFYKSMREEISAFIDEEKLVNEILHLNYVLSVVEKEIKDNKNESSDLVTFSFHIANPQNNDDWIVLFNSLIIRSQNPEDKFPYIYILWFLNHMDWNLDQLKIAINKYDIVAQPYIFKWLQKICRCLSYQKQKQIKEVAHYFNFEYEIYIPVQIIDALKYVNPIKSGVNYNLFDLIDHILGDIDEVIYDKDGNIIYHEVNTNSSNNFICLYKWFTSENPLEDYQLLKSVYSLVSYERQFRIIQRYFHDVRLGNISLDVKLVENFKDNDYLEFMRYRYCINTPNCRIKVGNQLLCDCILTLNETHGKSFQSFNGILDLVINQSDVTNPKIDLGLSRFLPSCNGGAVYNDSFIGFIDYSIIVSLDENKFTSENLRRTIIKILETTGKKINYNTYEDDKSSLHKKTKCIKLSEYLNLEKNDNMLSTTYGNMWTVVAHYFNWLNLSVNQSLDNNTNQDIEISIENISVEKFKESIYKIALNYKALDLGTYIIHSKEMDSFECKLLFEYSIPKAMRIYPQKQTYIGSKFDLFNIKGALPQNLTNEEFLKELRKYETNEVTERIVSSLNTILKNSIYNGEYFETTYNKYLLGKIRRLYYYNKINNTDIKEYNLSFLESRTYKANSLFCAPKLAEVHNQATNLPFFWCRGKECFHNNLDKQSLENNNLWSKYTIFHLAEIMGFPKLRKVDGGYEPDSIISLFIVVANKAVKKFIRLKCHTCGHLIYPIKRDNFDRNNYYSCINPTCLEYEKNIYLNFCYRCKSGLIDSRDTKQCPNGWYICPTCLSCCDDEQYDRLVQRYEISKLQIPSRIKLKLGKGHNDKGCYFCPFCGSKLDILYNKDNSSYLYCSSCNKTFKNIAVR